MPFLFLEASPEDELWLRLQLLLGPWPDLYIHLEEVVFVIISSRRQSLQQVGAVLIIVHNIWSGDCFCHQYSS